MASRKAHHLKKATEHMDKSMHHHERASHDGQHDVPATGEMKTVKRVAGGKVVVGDENECGGHQGDAGIDGADPE